MRRAAGMTIVAFTSVVGCVYSSSPPPRYYTLAATPAPGRADYAGPSVRLEAVHLPRGLSGQNMTRATPTYEVEVRHRERWNESLDNLMRQTLGENLVSRLPEGLLVFPGAPRPQGALSWVVDVLGLSEHDGQLRCEASWSLLSNTLTQTVETRQAIFSAKIDDSAESTAAALSQIAADLADAMVSSLPDAAASLRAAPQPPADVTSLPSGT